MTEFYGLMFVLSSESHVETLMASMWWYVRVGPLAMKMERS